MTAIHDISRPQGLQPKAQFFEEVGDVCINTDGIISLMETIDTSKAKAIHKAFRKRHAQIRVSDPYMDPKKKRSDAVLAALKDVGVNVTLKPIGGK